MNDVIWLRRGEFRTFVFSRHQPHTFSDFLKQPGQAVAVNTETNTYSESYTFGVRQMTDAALSRQGTIRASATDDDYLRRAEHLLYHQQEAEEKKGNPKSLGFLTRKQFEVLRIRAKGYSQAETASELGLSRASVSMIEGRARRKVVRAQATIAAFNQIRSHHKVVVPKGSRLQETPMLVLREADRFHTHIKLNMIDILRMVKKDRADCISGGRTTKEIAFIFNERGKLFLCSNSEQQ